MQFVVCSPYVNKFLLATPEQSRLPGLLLLPTVLIHRERLLVGAGSGAVSQCGCARWYLAGTQRVMGLGKNESLQSMEPE